MAARACIAFASTSEAAVTGGVHALLRRMASCHIRRAQEIVGQQRAVAAGDLAVRPYRELLSQVRSRNRRMCLPIRKR